MKIMQKSLATILAVFPVKCGCVLRVLAPVFSSVCLRLSSVFVNLPEARDRPRTARIVLGGKDEFVRDLQSSRGLVYGVDDPLGVGPPEGHEPELVVGGGAGDILHSSSPDTLNNKYRSGEPELKLRLKLSSFMCLFYTSLINHI